MSRRREEQTFLLVAILIGVYSGLSVVTFRLTIDWVRLTLFGSSLDPSRERVLLVPAIAAAFNSPITAVLFVIEEVIGRWSAGVLGAVVLSAVASVVTEQWFLGDEPLFRVPTYHLVHAAELIAYAALGLIGGAVSLVFVALVTHLRP